MEEFIQKISLKDVRCYAYHGWYPEEQIIGCWFTVHVEVEFFKVKTEEMLAKTLNYEDLNAIINRAMETPKKLLETVVEEILEEIRNDYPFINSAEITIIKHNPPMIGEVGSSVVSLKYTK